MDQIQAGLPPDTGPELNGMTRERKHHWETVYRNKAVEDTSWHQPVPHLSLALIANTGFSPESSLIDIGGGASLLVDHLLDQGFSDLTVLDISTEALAMARSRLGGRSARVAWVETDVTDFKPLRQFRLWHDRAAFHFLTDARDRRRYMEVLRTALVPEGQAILATFAPGGPEKCSGLEIVQYDAVKLGRELGPGFILLEQHQEQHRTPGGGHQLFNFFRFLKSGNL